MIWIYEWYSNLANLGYIGIFIISLFGTSSIFFNAAYYSLVYAMGATPIYNRFILILSSSMGAALGDFVSYAVGYGASKLIIKTKYFKYFEFGEKWFKKNGFLTIIFFTLTPLPDDIVGIVAGSAHYAKMKFYLGCLVGKFVQTALLIYAGKFSYDYFFK
jgi:membrane protein YqaA with SNARE-associated domain